ncbi:MAG: glutamate 5-kinase [Lachnospiraceae bacterium]|nr:glutamate 5-kinase [Lachnospiraceae bacterium]
MTVRETLKDKKRIVIKIGSSSLTHPETGRLDLIKMEVLVRELTDLRNQGKDIILVSSGAVAAGRETLGLDERPTKISVKQACASVGQARLMMIYQKLFSEYNQICSQVLLTKSSMLDNHSRENAKNTFNELLHMGVIPIVNENDTIALHELYSLSVFGDNDTLSAVVASLVDADLLLLMSDIDGMYTDDPRKNPDARFIDTVEKLDDELLAMGKGSSTDFGTGGMATKLSAATIASASGADMIIANGCDFHNIHRIMAGESLGTLFLQNKKDDYFVIGYLQIMYNK